MKLKDFLKLHPMFSVVVLFALMVSATSFYLDQYIIAVAELVLSVILAVIVFLAERNSFNDLKKTVGILNSYLYSEGDKKSGNVPLPFVICSANGSVVWYNELFEKNIFFPKFFSQAVYFLNIVYLIILAYVVHFRLQQLMSYLMLVFPIFLVQKYQNSLL